MMFIPNHSEQHKDIMQHTIFPPEEVINELIKSGIPPTIKKLKNHGKYNFNPYQ